MSPAAYSLTSCLRSYFEVQILHNPDTRGGLAIGVCDHLPSGPETHSIHLQSCVLYNSNNGLLGRNVIGIGILATCTNVMLQLRMIAHVPSSLWSSCYMLLPFSIHVPSSVVGCCYHSFGSLLVCGKFASSRVHVDRLSYVFFQDPEPPGMDHSLLLGTPKRIYPQPLRLARPQIHLPPMDIGCSRGDCIAEHDVKGGLMLAEGERLGISHDVVSQTLQWYHNGQSIGKSTFRERALARKKAGRWVFFKAHHIYG